MYTIVRRALPSLCLIVFAFSAHADPCAPRFRGDVFAVKLRTPPLAGQIAYLVFDETVYSEYLHTPETGDTRMVATGKLSRARFADLHEELTVHLPASVVAQAREMIFRIEQHQLIAEGGIALPQVIDAENPVATFEDLNGSSRSHHLTPRAEAFIVHPNMASLFCCAACWAAHTALTAEGCVGVGLCMDYHQLDGICCLGGC